VQNFDFVEFFQIFPDFDQQVWGTRVKKKRTKSKISVEIGKFGLKKVTVRGAEGEKKIF
jgi:hypothetical protein